VIEIPEFFSVPENRGKFQYPIPESALRARCVIILLGRPDVGSLR
jgi:hypothetical protein